MKQREREREVEDERGEAFKRFILSAGTKEFFFYWSWIFNSIELKSIVQLCNQHESKYKRIKGTKEKNEKGQDVCRVQICIGYKAKWIRVQQLNLCMY